MEHQISQLIQKYHHKANSQGQARIKYTHSAEMIRAVLNAPEDSMPQLVTQVQKNMGVSELPFRVNRWLEDNQLHGAQPIRGARKAHRMGKTGNPDRAGFTGLCPQKHRRIRLQSPV